MKVLSLFDGISCARVALDRLGIVPEAYYASEIEPTAIAISQIHWPDIIQLGDVRGIRSEDVGGGIDLLIGGSPCQDLSRAKHGREGLKGSRSSLFYEYLRLLKEIQPRFFVLENVMSMPQEARDEISKELGVQPIMIDAALVSAQSRRRLFWTNIPGVCQPWDRGILVRHILEGAEVEDPPRAHSITKPVRLGHIEGTKGTQCTRVYSTDGKSIVLNASNGGNKSGFYWPVGEGQLAVREATKKGYAVASDGDTIDVSFPNSTTRRGRVGKKAKNLMTTLHISVFTRGEVRPLTEIECERLQSLPDRYTEGVPKGKRISALGNAFNVEVVRHILAHMGCA